MNAISSCLSNSMRLVFHKLKLEKLHKFQSILYYFQQIIFQIRRPIWSNTPAGVFLISASIPSEWTSIRMISLSCWGSNLFKRVCIKKASNLPSFMFSFVYLCVHEIPLLLWHWQPFILRKCPRYILKYRYFWTEWVSHRHVIFVCHTHNNKHNFLTIAPLSSVTATQGYRYYNHWNHEARSHPLTYSECSESHIVTI